jgi:Mor family transcriptional regulator
MTTEGGAVPNRVGARLDGPDAIDPRVEELLCIFVDHLHKAGALLAQAEAQRPSLICELGDALGGQLVYLPRGRRDGAPSTAISYVSVRLFRTVLQRLFREALARLEVPPRHDIDQAAAFIAHVQDSLAGSSFYLPKFTAEKQRLRQLAVIDGFTGHNHAALALQHGYSIKHVYKILRRERLHRAGRLKNT